MQNHVDLEKKRRLATIVAGVLTILSLVLLGISIFGWPLSYDLALWFVSLLCFFHLIFFFRTSTTQRQVKLIDYPYLLIGAIAVFIAFSESDKDRKRYLSTFDEITAPSTTEGLQIFVRRALERFCINKDGYVPQNFCQWNNQISQFLSSGFNHEELAQQISKKQKAIIMSSINDQKDVLLYYFSSPKRFFRLVMIPIHGRLEFLNPFELVNRLNNEPLTIQTSTSLVYPLIIRSMQKIYEKPVAQQAQSASLPEPFDIAALEQVGIGLGKTLVWPFVLAIALALRLTKVTADVLGWALPDQR